MRNVFLIALLVGAAGTASAQEQSTQVPVQIVPRTMSKIGASMSGTLSEFSIRDGEHFAAGQIIARFRCARENAVLLRAKAELGKRIGIAGRQREARLLGANTVQDTEVARSEVEVARGELAVADAAVQDCTMTAPFAGRAADVVIRNNQFLAAGAPMFDALDDGDMEAEMIMPSSVLGWMKPGYKVTIKIGETGTEIQAVLDRFGGRVDAVSRTIKAYARPEHNSGNLLPGMSGSAEIREEVKR